MAPQPDPGTDASGGRAGRRAALVLAATGLFWIATTWAGAAWGWPVRVRVLLDLIALAGFGLALFMTYQVWRARRTDPR